VAALCKQMAEWIGVLIAVVILASAEHFVSDGLPDPPKVKGCNAAFVKVLWPFVLLDFAAVRSRDRVCFIGLISIRLVAVH